MLPAGADAAQVLLGNPSIVLSLERGASRLGPGAEF